jgi:cytochrome P450
MSVKTACLLTYVTYLIALNPAVTEKLRAEVLARCGPLGIPTYEDIRQMKYSTSSLPICRASTDACAWTVRAVLNETLRLFPPVPLNIRETRAAGCTIPIPDSTYPSPIPSTPLYMPPSTTTVFFPLLTQRNQALWGDDADEFDPERWIDPERLAKYTANPAMFSPFGAGPRIVRPSPHHRSLSQSEYLPRSPTVSGAKLCIQRSIVLPRPAPAALRHLRARTRSTTSRFAAPARVEKQ